MSETFEIRFTESGAKEIIRSFNEFVDGAETAEESTDRLTGAINRLRREADPTQKAYDRLAGQMNILSRAQEGGIIAAAEAAQIQQRLTLSTQAQLNPVGALISQIRSETQAWTASTAERTAALSSMRQITNLQKQGILVSEQEQQAIIAANVALQQQKSVFNENAAAKRQTLQDQIKFDRDYAAAVEEDRRRTSAALRKEEADQASAAARIKAENDAVLASYNSVYKQSGNSVERATARQAAALAVVDEARSRGLITAGQVADSEARIERQYAEQIDPLQRIERLQRERINYMSGLAAEGRQLGLVNADLARLDQQGIRLDQQRVNSLRQLAIQADKLQHTYQALGEAKTLVSNLLGGFTLGLATAGLAKELDTVTLLNNRLKLVASDTANANTLFEKNVELAAATRSDLESTVEGFSRIARSTKQIGLSQQAALDLTKSVNEALKISGASAQEASATVVQFGQALSSNRLGGDELRSVLEQAPRLSQAIVDGINAINKTDPTQLPKKLADALKKTGDINIGTMRTLAKQGVLTTKVVSDAVLNQQSVLDSEFQRTIPTIADSFTVLNTRWLDFLNNFNKGTGAARTISGAILFIANHLDSIAKIGIVVGTTLAAAFVGTSIQKFLNFVTGLPGAFSASTAAVSDSTIAINNENAALARNTQLQIANAESRAAVAGGATAATVARTTTGTISAIGQATAGGVTAAESALTSRNLQTGAAAAAAMRAQLQGTAGAAGAAAAETGILATASRAAGAAGTFLVGAISKLAVVAGVIGALIGLYLTLKDTIKLADDQLLIYGEGSTQKAIKGTITLGDTVGGVFSAIANTISGKTDSITQSQLNSIQTVTDAHKESKDKITEAEAKAAQDKLDIEAQSEAKTLSVYDNLKSGAVKTTIDIVAAVANGWKFFTDSIAVGLEYIILGGYKIANQLGNLFIGFYNSAIVPVLNAAKSVGIGNGATEAKLLNTKFDAAALAKQSGDELAAQRAANEKALKEGLARSIVSTAADRQRNSALGGLNGAGLNTVTDNNNTKNKKSKVDPDIAAYKSLRNELDPLAKATEDYQKNVDLLDRALQKHLITTDGVRSAEQIHDDLMARLKKRYDEAINPLKKYTSDTLDEISVLSVSQDKRQLETTIMEKEHSLRDKLNRDLTDSEKARIREVETFKQAAEQRTALNDNIQDAARNRAIELGQIGLTSQQLEAEQRARQTLGDAIKNNVDGWQEDLKAQTAVELQFIQTRDAAKRVSDVYDELTKNQRTFAQDSNALNTLFNANRISLERYNRELRALALNVLQDSTTALAGFERALIQIKNQTEDMATDISTTITGVFNDTRSEFQNFFQTGQFDLHKILSNVTGNLAGALFDKATNPLVNSIGNAFNIPGFGKSALTDQQIQANNVYLSGNIQGLSQFGGLGLPTQGATGLPSFANDNNAAANDNTIGGVFGNPSGVVSQNQNAVGQITNLWNGAAQAISGNWTGAFSTMLASNTAFQTASVATNAAIQTSNTATAGAGVAVHTAAETAKTAATATGSAARTAAEATASATSKGFTISDTLLQIGANAAKAATGAYAAIASIPVVGPVLAPITAAAALAGVISLGKSIFSARDGFGQVPYDGAVTELHKDEMVLPKKYADPLRDQLTTGGGKGKDQPAPAPQVHVNQQINNIIDPKGMVDVMTAPAGVKAIINVIQMNPEAVKRALSA